MLTETRYIFYICLYVCLGLCMSYSWNLFAIIIFIFIINNHITSLIQTNLFFGNDCQTFSLRVLLRFCLNFCKFQPGVAYKSVVYKKSVYFQKLNKVQHGTAYTRVPLKRGYHVHMKVWSPLVGECFLGKKEPSNRVDTDAVAVISSLNNFGKEEVVGHLL